MAPVLKCEFCSTRAGAFAAQSDEQGAVGTVTWVPVCDGHLDGWNAGGDWPAPAYQIGAAIPRRVLAGKR